MTFPNKLLIPVELDGSADGAIDVAYRFLAERSSERPLNAILMHAYELPNFAFLDGAWMASAEDASRIANAAQRKLDELATAFRERAGDKATVETLLRTGNADVEILTVAEESKADMILMGTHHRGGAMRALLGSIVTKVVASATIPVIVVPPER